MNFKRYLPQQLSRLKKSSSILLQAFIISILLLAACSQTKQKQSEIWDNSLMASNPCPPPCFYGIEPGVTTLSEAEYLLQSAGLCLDPSYARSSSPTEPVDLLCENLLSVSTDSSQVITRLVSIYTPPRMTVEMAFDQLGYPDAVAVDAYGKGEGEGSYMNLYYKNGFTRLILFDQDSSDYNLAKDTLVDWIIYYEEGFFLELYEETSPWSGYGLYPPDF